MEFQQSFLKAQYTGSRSALDTVIHLAGCIPHCTDIVINCCSLALAATASLTAVTPRRRGWGGGGGGRRRKPLGVTWVGGGGGGGGGSKLEAP